MPILQGIVEKHNYLTDEAMVEVAKELDISAAEVYGTASFYTFLDTKVKRQICHKDLQDNYMFNEGKGRDNSDH